MLPARAQSRSRNKRTAEPVGLSAALNIAEHGQDYPRGGKSGGIELPGRYYYQDSAFPKFFCPLLPRRNARAGIWSMCSHWIVPALGVQNDDQHRS
jgi:hypothetical protein